MRRVDSTAWDDVPAEAVKGVRGEERKHEDGNIVSGVWSGMQRVCQRESRSACADLLALLSRRPLHAL